MNRADIEHQIETDIASKLNRCGMMFRMFGRAKTKHSLAHKMEIKGDKYRSGASKIQDIIGVRIIVYFTDDVEVVKTLFENRNANVVDMSIDRPDSNTFCPQRLNLVCSVPDYLVDNFRKALVDNYGDNADYIDNTFEVQIRTIFSEGWHEVEHDLRYKCKEDWVGYDKQSRTLNGVIATLENAEFSMLSLFKDMALSNYNQGNYSAMLRNHLRIRLTGNGLSPEIIEYLQNNPEVAKAVYEADRGVVMTSLLYHKHKLKLHYDNVLFLMNHITMELLDEGLMALESEAFKEDFEKFKHAL